jgi:NDMA-dependent alcohol dehydrogenase
MKTRAAILEQPPGKWEVVEIEMDPPRQGELLIKMIASGLCHSDDHLVTGDLPVSLYPVAGGHEGAGIVAEVGPNTPGWEVGEHVVLTFVPGCGQCRWCASGMQNLCDRGADTVTGVRSDGSYRLSRGGVPIGQMAGISTFSQWSTVSVLSAIKCPEEVPLDRACLLGCGVGTGWGSAVHSANVRPGDVVIVMGTGGIGINAVQGASHAGASVIVAVDPVELKRTVALALGATHATSTMEEAAEIVSGYTNGQGADSCIVCVGVTSGEHIAQGVDAIRKGGTVVATGIGKVAEVGIPISTSHVTLFQKRIQGALFGASSPAENIPLMIQLYRQGRLHLDELVTRTYTLEQINEGYADMHAGQNIRGVILHHH